MSVSSPAPVSASRITTPVDLERAGRQQGFLRIPHSTHESAYGWIPIPIVCLKNGEGPTMLLMAGNHGDEYEGQVVLSRLARTLSPEQVRGRLIILPAVNAPAAAAGRRTSPIDGGNLNRSFPGDPGGTPTSMIAHYIDSVLLPLCQYAADFHSGGSSLAYVPCAQANVFPGMEERNKAVLELLEVFAAPVSYVATRPMGAEQAFGASARRRGVIAFGTEAGGGGTVNPSAVRMLEGGLHRVLCYLGLVPHLPATEARGTRLVEVGGADYFVYASESGLFEPCVELGDEVEAGQLAGLIHFPQTPWREPEPMHFARDGMVLCKRTPGRTECGDCVAHLGSDYRP
jgi:predicted deacylase